MLTPLPELSRPLRIEEPPPFRTAAWVNELYDTIHGLPSDTISIAMKFHDLGIKGKPNNGQNCPLSIYLDRLPFVKSSVDHTYVYAWPRDLMPHQITASDAEYLHHLAMKHDGCPFVMQMPAHVREFVWAFDRGAFPMLVAA